MAKRPAIFFDRDGTLNINHGYVHTPEKFEWTPKAPEAIRWANQQGYWVFVVTNQAGIARGYYTGMQFLEFTQWIDQQLVAENAYIDHTFYCPHHPEGTVEPYNVVCECRKPKTGMLKQAVERFEVDLGRSLMVGDKDLDVQAAENFGIPGFKYEQGSLLDLIKRAVYW